MDIEFLINKAGETHRVDTKVIETNCAVINGKVTLTAALNSGEGSVFLWRFTQEEAEVICRKLTAAIKEVSSGGR